MTDLAKMGQLQRSDPKGIAVLSERCFLFLTLLLAGALTIYLACVAWRLRIDYFDSFDILLNAKAIATRSLRDWRAWRSLGLPMFLAPWFAAAPGIGSANFAFRAAHLTAVAFWAALLLICYQLFRLHLSRPAAITATLLLTFNPLLIHYAPTAKEDIPATFFIVACFYAYLKASERQSRTGFLVAGAIAGLAITTRQNLAPLLFGLVLTTEVGRAIHQRDKLGAYVWKFTALLLLPTAIFFLSPMIAYPRVGLSSAMTSPGVLIDDIRDHMAQTRSWKDESIAKNFRFLAKAASLPVIVLSIGGMIVGGIRRRPGALFHFLWLCFFFGVQTFAFKHREARFLFPAFPPIYFFAGIAMDALVKSEIATAPARRYEILIAVYVFVFVFAMPLAPAWNECARLRDAVYFNNVEEDVGQTAVELAGSHSITWIGPYYPLHPRDYLFDRGDDSTSLYHLGPNAITYFAGRRIREIRVGGCPADDLGQLRRALSGSIDTARDGDVFIINRESDAYDSGTIPTQLKPLVICRIRAGGLRIEAEFAEP